MNLFYGTAKWAGNRLSSSKATTYNEETSTSHRVSSVLHAPDI